MSNKTSKHFLSLLSDHLRKLYIRRVFCRPILKCWCNSWNFLRKVTNLVGFRANAVDFHANEPVSISFSILFGCRFIMHSVPRFSISLSRFFRRPQTLFVAIRGQNEINFKPLAAVLYMCLCVNISGTGETFASEIRAYVRKMDFILNENTRAVLCFIANPRKRFLRALCTL